MDETVFGGAMRSRPVHRSRLDGQVDIWDLAALPSELRKLGLDWPD